MAQWATAIRRPGNVAFINDPGLTDVMYLVAGDPNTLVINLAYFADLTDGTIAGAAIDTDSLTALQIGAGGVDTAELADNAVTGVKVTDQAVGLFEDTALTNVAFGGGTPIELLALDATVDRIVLVRAVATVAAVGGCDWDVGSLSDADGCFEFIGAGTFGIGDKFVGFYALPAGEALQCVLNVAGTAGAIDFYVTVVTPLVQTAQIADAAVTPVKQAYPSLDDPGTYAQAVGRAAGVWTARTGVPVAGDTVTIGTDVFEFDRIDLDSTDDTANNDWNNVTDPLTVPMAVGDYPACGVGGANPLVVGELIYIGTEYMRVTGIVGNDVTFDRGVGGSAIAVHANAVNIMWSASHISGLTANIQVGIQGANQAAAVGTPILVACINEDAGTAGQANDVSAASLAAGAIMLVTADAVGPVVLATTTVSANFLWDAATMLRGAAAGRKRVYSAAYTIDAAEVATTLYVPVPFAPTQVYYSVLRGAVIIVWDGTITVTAAAAPMPDYLAIADGGGAPFQAGDMLSIMAIE